MLEQLTLQQFTTFDQIDFSFAPGINVIIGENGTGKSHLLKIAYAISSTSHAASKSSPSPTKAQLQKDLASKMVEVFRPDKLEVKRRTKEELERAVDHIFEHFGSQFKMKF